MMVMRPLLCVLFIASLSHSPVFAAQLRVSFEGVVTEIQDGQGSPIEGTTFVPGDVLHGSYLFDATKRALLEHDIGREYRYQTEGFRFAIRDLVVVSNLETFTRYWDNITYDFLKQQPRPLAAPRDVVQIHVPIEGGEGRLGIEHAPESAYKDTVVLSDFILLAEDLTATAIAQTAFLVDPIDLRLFSSTIFQINLGHTEEGSLQIVGTVTSFSVTTVPEPSSLLVIGSGVLLGLFGHGLSLAIAARPGGVVRGVATPREDDSLD
jgi:hypothetical protein